jgi:glycosyltransferase involved in cell wall biosynthesis
VSVAATLSMPPRIDVAAKRPVALYFTRNLLTGGAERVVVNYANNARDLQAVVGLLERRGGLLGELHAGVPCLARVDRTVPQSRTSVLAARIPGELFARLVPECLWLRRAVKETNAAIVSSFLMRAHIVALLTKLTMLPDLTVVLNVHEHMTESAHFLYPRARDRVLMRWITRHLFPRADRIAVVAQELKRDLVHSHGVPGSLIEVAHNPLDIERVRAAAEIDLDPPPMNGDTRQIIVAVGRLVPLKGYDLLLHALALLRRTRDARLVIIGEGPALGDLEELAARLTLGDAVTFAGHQSNPWRFVTRADVFALTSRTEAFPSVLVETMALGVPVLATDCSAGVRECLRDGACGLVVPPEDAGAIARGLDRLLGDADLRAAFASAGRARAEEFDLRAVQRRYESMLTGAMASRSRYRSPSSKRA